MNPGAPTLDHYPLMCLLELLYSKKEIKIIIGFNAFMIAFIEYFIYARHGAKLLPISLTTHNPLRTEEKSDKENLVYQNK